jgi:hypothetical protein
MTCPRQLPNTRMQRTRSSPSALRSPLMRCPLGGWWRPLWLLLLSVHLAGVGLAESLAAPKGSLSVHVIDGAGGSLPGAAVVLYPADRPSEEAARGVTDSDGTLVIADLSLASYEVRVELLGLCADYAAVVLAGGDRIAKVTLTMSLEWNGCLLGLRRTPTPTPRPLPVAPVGRTNTPASRGARS